MLKAIGHGFSNLASFDGRDARQAFWFSTLFGTVVCVAGAALIALFPELLQGINRIAFAGHVSPFRPLGL